MAEYKVVLLGSTRVGKTSILTRWADGCFLESGRSTLGCSSVSLEYDDDDNDFNSKLMIWDTAGQDQFRETTSVYLRGATVAIIVFSIADRQSFEDVTIWKQMLMNQQELIPFILVGNKADLDEKRVVDKEAAYEMALPNKEKYTEVSAKTGYNCDLLFQTIGLYVEEISRTKLKPAAIDITQQIQTPKNKCC